jgi:Fe-S-cluster-containing hydrogenase component 2
MSTAQKKRLYIQEEKCNGCRICELRCSFEHDNCFSPSLSRITIRKNERKGISIPTTCVICCVCIDSCTEGALSNCEQTGAIKVHKEKCTGCQNCVAACPFNAMKIHSTANVAITCDLCSGHPQCVRYCPEDALHFLTAKEITVLNKKKNVKGVLKNQK